MTLNTIMYVFIKRILSWLSVLFFMALPVPIVFISVFIFNNCFGHLYYERDNLLFIITGEIAFLTVVCILQYFENTNFLHFSKLRVRPVIVSIVLGIACWTFGMLLYSIQYSDAHPSIRNNYALIRSILTFTVTPIVEEMFFRGWLLGYMEKKSFSKITIILTISTGFFFYHWLPFTPIYSRLDTFVFSVLSCCMYFKTRDLRYCILMHFAMNFINSMAAMIPYLFG